MTRLRLRPALVAIPLVLALSACGSDAGGDGPDASASTESAAPDEPVEGTTIEAEGFSYVVPEGWEENSAAAPGAVTLAVDTTDDDGFADNLNVVEDPTLAEASPDEVRDGIRSVLEAADASEVEVRDGTVDIDGAEAVQAGSLFDVNGNEYRVEQLALNHDGKGYVVTFSFSTGVSAEDRDALTSAVVASWSWA